jgi:flagellar hook-length control protein FliK
VAAAPAATAVAEVAPAVTAAPAEPVAPAPAAAAAPAGEPATPALPALPARPEPAARAASAAAPTTPAVPADPAAHPPAQPAAPAVPVQRAEAPAPAAQPAEAPASAPAPAATPAGVGGPASPAAPPVFTQRTAPLHHVPRVVGTLLHVAHEKGITHARISLRPDDLGGIEVRLQSSPQGVSAQLVADSPEAARLLAQAGDDLRRSLEARDVHLLSLEVSTSGDQQRQGERPGQTSDPDAPAAPGRVSGEAEGDDAVEAPVGVGGVGSMLELPGGLLVDVLA